MDADKQLEIIKRGAVEIVSEQELKKKLEKSIKTKRPLKIKAGFDPTAPDIHLGHSVLLRKMRQFQDLGHEVIFLIGDFTGRIGDPSGRKEIRKQLDKEEVLKNAVTYKKQVSKILDPEKIRIAFNSEWFDKMPVLEMLKLTRLATVSQMLAREDFKKRLTRGEDISLLEFMYPLLQGYDSVKLEADVELGGTDQIFNLLVGRDIQRDFGQAPQVIITMPLLEGTDGARKMSKSYANYIGINEPPKEIFGKVMSIPDDLMMKYYQLLSEEPLNEIKKMHPKEAKLKLAQHIVAQYHSKEAASKSREEFERVFSQKEFPEEMRSHKIGPGRANLVDILVDSGLAPTKNEARRLIQQGSVYLGSERIDKADTVISEDGVLKVGKRRFLKLEK